MLINSGHQPARAAPGPGDADSWDFGYSAGFYVDATVAPWSQYYRMYSYVTRELPELIAANLPAKPDAAGISAIQWRARRAGVRIAQSGPVNRFRIAPIAARCSPGKGGFANYLERILRVGASTMPASWAHAPFPGPSHRSRHGGSMIRPSTLPEIFATSSLASYSPNSEYRSR